MVIETFLIGIITFICIHFTHFSSSFYITICLNCVIFASLIEIVFFYAIYLKLIYHVYDMQNIYQTRPFAFDFYCYVFISFFYDDDDATINVLSINVDFGGCYNVSQQI